MTKNSDNTENTGREITNILASQHSPRYNDMTPVNKSLITGRSPRFDINDQSNSSIKIPRDDCLNEKKNDLEEEKQIDESQKHRLDNKLHTIISEIDKEKSESINHSILEFSKIHVDQLVNYEDKTKLNIINIEESQKNENINTNEPFQNHIINNKSSHEYHKKSQKPLNEFKLNIMNIPDTNVTEEKTDQNNDPKPTIDFLNDEKEANLKTALRVRSKNISLPLQLGDIGIVCDQESQLLDSKKIIELSIKESERSNAGTCLVCFDKEPDAVLMDCGHGGILFCNILNHVILRQVYAIIVHLRFGKLQTNAIYVEM